MKPYRAQKISGLIKEEISLIMIQKVHDPRLGLINVLNVSISSDLKLAKIYISVIGDKEAKRQVEEALKNAKGFIKKELSKRIIMKYMPDIEFIIDTYMIEGEE